MRISDSTNGYTKWAKLKTVPPMTSSQMKFAKHLFMYREQLEKTGDLKLIWNSVYRYIKQNK